MNTTKVRLQVTLLRTDPTPYKVYAPEITPCNLYVEVEVPDKFVISDESQTVISPDGLANLVSQLAQSFSAEFGKVTKG